MLTRRPMWNREWIKFWLGGNKWRRKSTGGTSIINRNIFLHLSPQLLGFWVSRTNSYLLIWVNSWPRKWKNQFLMFQVPYGIRIQTGSWVKHWDWHNKFLVPMYFHAQLRNLTHQNPPLLLVFRNTVCVRNIPPPPMPYGRDGAHGYVPRQVLWHKTRLVVE